jgi:hypothetical protein
MDYDDDIKFAITREFYEDVELYGDLQHRVIDVDNPMYLAKCKRYTGSNNI